MTISHPAVADRRGVAAIASMLAALIGCAALLAGCNTAQPVAIDSVPSDYRQRHPIAIKEGDRTFEIFVGAKRGELTATQRAEVMAFAHRWRREATGGIIIDLPSGTRNEVAAANALHEVRSLMSAAGVPPQGVVVRPYRPADPTRLATIKLNYPKIVADAGPCGQWPDDLGPTMSRRHFENAQYWNLGCATQRNLAAMVDDPSDLVQPRSETPIFAGRRSIVLGKYKEGQSTATTYPDASKGQISDVGR